MNYNITVSPYQENVIDTQYHFKQQDYGMTFSIFIEDYDTSGTTCRIVFRRSDNIVREYTIEKSSDGSFKYNISANETYSVGKTIVDLKFYKNNVRESTASFIYYVVPDESGEHFDSGDYFDAVEAVVGVANKAIEQCNTVTKTVNEKLTNNEFDGFSPIISENEGNSSSIYKLDITTKSGKATTPNLKGQDGNGSGDMQKSVYDPQNKEKDIFEELELKVNKTSISNNLTTETEGSVLDARQGKVLQEKIDATNVRVDSKQDKRKLLWSGSAVSSGAITFSTLGYSTFEFHCTDGCVLRGVKVYDSSNSRHYATISTTGSALSGTNWLPAMWYGIVDIYDTHMYLQFLNLITLNDSAVYKNKSITEIYGVM